MDEKNRIACIKNGRYDLAADGILEELWCKKLDALPQREKRKLPSHVIRKLQTHHQNIKLTQKGNLSPSEMAEQANFETIVQLQEEFGLSADLSLG